MSVKHLRTDGSNIYFAYVESSRVNFDAVSSTEYCLSLRPDKRTLGQKLAGVSPTYEIEILKTTQRKDIDDTRDTVRYKIIINADETISCYIRSKTGNQILVKDKRKQEILALAQTIFNEAEKAWDTKKDKRFAQDGIFRHRWNEAIRLLANTPTTTFEGRRRSRF